MKEIEPTSSRRAFWHKPVFKIVIGYLVGSWTILEFLNFILERRELSPHWSDLFLYADLMFIPSILAISFLHSTNKQKKGRSIILITNAIIILCVLFFSFRTKDLGSVRKKIVYIDDNGKEQVEYILKEDFKMQLAFANFEVSKKLDSGTWTAKGLKQGLRFAHAQFETIFSSMVPIEYERLSAQLTYIRDHNMQYLIRGSIDTIPGQYLVNLDIYSNSGKVSEIQFQHHDYLKLFDLSKDNIVSALKLQIQEKYLPFKELMTDNVLAYQKFVEQDYDAAWKLDPKFSIAYALSLLRAITFNQSTDYAKMVATEMLKTSDRLPEPLQQILKMYYYYVNGNLENCERVYEHFSSKHPLDKDIPEIYATIMSMAEQYSEAKRVYYQLLNDKGASKNEILPKVLAIHLHLQEYDAYEKLINEYKNDLREFKFLETNFLLNLSRGNLKEAESFLTDMDINDPTYYAMDSLRKILHYSKSLSQTDFGYSDSRAINYLNTRSNQVVKLSERQYSINAKWGNQPPVTIFRIADHTFFYYLPFENESYMQAIKVDTQSPVVKGYYSRKAHGLRTSEGYLLDGDELLALNQFWAGNFNEADSLLKEQLHDVFFLDQFIHACDWQIGDNDIEIYKWIDGLKFNRGRRQYHLVLQPTYISLRFKSNWSRLYPIGGNWFFNSYRKSELYRVNDNNQIELHQYDYIRKTYELKFTFDLYDEAS